LNAITIIVACERHLTPDLHASDNDDTGSLYSAVLLTCLAPTSDSSPATEYPNEARDNVDQQAVDIDNDTKALEASIKRLEEKKASKAELEKKLQRLQDEDHDDDHNPNERSTRVERSCVKPQRVDNRKRKRSIKVVEQEETEQEVVGTKKDANQRAEEEFLG
jgi:hypothetical protein